MTPRIRKLVGTLALIALIAVYALLVVAVAAVLQVQNTSKAVELAFYIIAGVLWTLPGGWLIRWMQRTAP